MSTSTPTQVTSAPGFGSGRRIRQQAREAALLMGFSAGLSVLGAAIITTLSHLGL